jgi:hypothetical protein
MKLLPPLALSTIALSASLVLAACSETESAVTMQMISADGTGESIGTVSLKDSAAGLVLTPTSRA